MSASVTREQYTAAFAAFRAEAKRETLDTGRYRMPYFVWGRGPAVVFVHGMADHAAGFVMVSHQLREQFTCVGYELPNGLTDSSQLARYTLTNYTADLVTLLDHLKLETATIVGSSFGSLIALHSLATPPERFTHGVLQNGFAYRPLSRWQRFLARSARFWPGWFADWPEIYRQIMLRVDRQTLPAVPDAVAELYLANGGNTTLQAAALRSLTIDRADLRPQLPSIRQSMLLLTSDQDPLVPQWCWDELERGLPHLLRVEFANCGHHPQYTHPTAMAEAIASFLLG